MKKQAMRKVTVEVPVSVDCDDNGMSEYLGKNVVLFCVNYIWSGRLAGVNGDHVLLEDGGIVFETGEFNSTKFKDFQKLGHEIRIPKAMIEAYGPTNKT